MRVRIAGIAAIVIVTFALPATSQPSPMRAFTIAAAGDIIPHGMLVAAGNDYLPGPGWDFTPMVAAIEPWVSHADLAICHMEGTLSSTNTGISGYPRFVGPREMATAIAAAGWDTCSTASNHAMDAGWSGVVSTLDVLDAAGVAHTGTARTPDERLPEIYEVNGVAVGHISYTYGTNGLAVPADRPWAVNVLDADAILSDAAWVRDQGAEFIVVSLHWGLENYVPPTEGQRALAETLLASDDIDLILGHHAHVVQPVDRIGDKYVVYGMGNHLTNQFSRWGPDYFGTEDGLMVQVHVSERADGSFAVDAIELIPTWVEFRSYRVLPVTDALLTGAGPTSDLEASLEHTLSRALALSAPGVGLAQSPWPEVSCEGMRATIVGTPADDELVGTDAADVIIGRAGADRIDGGGGDDIVCGGAGADRIDGGTGRDLVSGGDGNDVLSGESRDILFGDGGTDHCSTEAPLRDCEH